MTMQTRELFTQSYSDGKVIVVDRTEDEEVVVYDIGNDDEEIAVYGHRDGRLDQMVARKMAEEYALGYLHDKE